MVHIVSIINYFGAEMKNQNYLGTGLTMGGGILTGLPVILKIYSRALFSDSDVDRVFQYSTKCVKSII
jgi:hypothetical protein